MSCLKALCIALSLLVSAGSFAADVVLVPNRTVSGTLDERARMQKIHAAMRRECGASPGSERCRRLTRAFQHQAKACEKAKRTK